MKREELLERIRVLTTSDKPIPELPIREALTLLFVAHEFLKSDTKTLEAISAIPDGSNPDNTHRAKAALEKDF